MTAGSSVRLSSPAKLVPLSLTASIPDRSDGFVVSTSMPAALRLVAGTVVTVIMLPARSTGALPFNTIVSTDRVSAFSLASTV